GRRCPAGVCVRRSSTPDATPGSGRPAFVGPPGLVFGRGRAHLLRETDALTLRFRFAAPPAHVVGARIADPPATGGTRTWATPRRPQPVHHLRSEERRVGKECSSRWAPERCTKSGGRSGWASRL